MSFTTGGLFLHESVVLSSLYLKLSDWTVVREKVIQENLLQTRTRNSLMRISREIISRLKTLTRSELEFLVEGSNQDQCYLLWIAVCRRYKFIAEFAIEVLRERYITLKSVLPQDEFDAFFHRKAEMHLELDMITRSTQSKLRQVLYKMLREADIITNTYTINAVLLSPKLMGLIRQTNPGDVFYFPVFDDYIKGATP